MHISLNKKRISLLRDWGFLPARQQPTRLTLYVPFGGDIILEGQICNLVSEQVSTFNLTVLTGSGGYGWPLKTGLQLVSEFWEALMCYTGVHCHLSECNWVGENCENLGILVKTKFLDCLIYFQLRGVCHILVCSSRNTCPRTRI